LDCQFECYLPVAAIAAAAAAVAASPAATSATPTSASVPAVTSTSAASTAAFSLGASFVDNQGATEEVFSVQCSDRFFGFRVITDFSETKASRLSRKAVAKQS
jgi:hypothetical protein